MENNAETENNNEIEQNNEINNNLTKTNIFQPSIYYYNTSNDYYHSKKYNKALINITIYIKLVPNNQKAYLLKGKIYLNLSQYENSLKAFLRSKHLGENSLELLYGLARSYKQLHQYD